MKFQTSRLTPLSRLEMPSTSSSRQKLRANQRRRKNAHEGAGYPRIRQEAESGIRAGRSTCSHRAQPNSRRASAQRALDGAAQAHFRVISRAGLQTSKKPSRRSGLLFWRTPLLLKLVIERIRHSPCCQTRATDCQSCGAYRPAGRPDSPSCRRRRSSHYTG
ncbi:hypothetical protein CN198_29710 [Sinorhizobium meliloti]|nr:hypothetical protein CN198_29710 [Sinorhizobium meliloti]